MFCEYSLCKTVFCADSFEKAERFQEMCPNRCERLQNTTDISVCTGHKIAEQKRKEAKTRYTVHAMCLVISDGSEGVYLQ